MSDIQIIHGDCMEAMAKMKDKEFELAIVDPPYGLGSRVVDGGSVSPRIRKENGNVKEWDKIPSLKYFWELYRVSRNQIIWGGNYFTLPSFRCFIIWDKTIYGNTYSDGELAWTSFDSPARIWKKNIVQVTMDGRIHPTQKPVALYQWLLKNYAKQGDKILDTHLGSGSSAIAYDIMGFDFVGYEIDEDYYNAALERFNRHKQQTVIDFKYGGVKWN